MKVDDAGEGQQKIIVLLTVVTNRPAPPLDENEAAFKNTERRKVL
jgi:hypothetical protein